MKTLPKFVLNLYVIKPKGHLFPPNSHLHRRLSGIRAPEHSPNPFQRPAALLFVAGLLPPSLADGGTATSTHILFG